MLVDMIDDFSNFKVLIVKNANIEYFDLSEKVIIHDDNLFERRKTLVQEQWEI